ncbi:MAG: His/Gly/Thr/Pro-type tRNA ligase C-terminal domain-containing protein, partial [Candidatus Omnitrophica bacterium]|nr:His/Gly/Thr/Pro-type tRNA ligase C-terminal domain-containing protein [Candidatus Omnitrophota bacterium]
FSVEPMLVRGLDYYTRTVFEIKHKSLGAQDAIGAGGRYDGLSVELSGPQTGAMGFAFGVERVFLALTPEEQKAEGAPVYVISLGEGAEMEKLKVLDELRRNAIPATTNLEAKSLKAALRQANDMKARFVVIIGEDELQKGLLTLKDMAEGSQKQVERSALIPALSVLKT